MLIMTEEFTSRRLQHAISPHSMNIHESMILTCRVDLQQGTAPLEVSRFHLDNSESLQVMPTSL